ncbi:MAG: xylulokinase [Deltaproteobacteria bacterium]|nr:xylulokinase [Deltaproteobacteria bacterium]MBN2671106.1 xylulokinase [Deltaproteobacteria bacterium]
MNNTLVMGIDVGTQSSKVLIYDVGNKTIAAMASSAHDIIRQSDGTSEQDPAWWEAAIIDGISKLDAALVAKVQAIGVSGQQHGFVPLGNTGVLYNAKLWNDTSTSAECAEIEERFGGASKMIAEVGNPMLPGYTAPKIAWLKNNQPELYSQLTAILLPHDYINYLLTGVLAMEHGDASGTGLLNIRTRTWDDAVLRAVDPDRNLTDCLPPLIDAAAVHGYVTEDASLRFGIPTGIPVCTGGGDNMMAAIGTGCTKAGTVSASMGTSGTIFAYADRPVIDDNGEVAAFCDSTGGWLPLVCTMNCTVATELVRDIFEISVQELDKDAASIPPGSDGVLMLPFFTGERTPNLPDAKGSIIGLTPGNFTRGHLARAAMESALFGLRYGLDAIAGNGLSPKTIHLTGGGAKSQLWRQMAADILGCNVRVPQVEEAAAFGAALKALWMLKNTEQSTFMAEITEAHVTLSDELISPNSQSQQTYNHAYQKYLNAVQTIPPLFSKK